MRAVKELWTPTTRLYDRADEGQPRKFILDCGIAWQNYRDDVGVFQEIDLTPALSDVAGYAWMLPRVPYRAYLGLDGARRVHPDRNNLGKFVRFPANKFLANKTFTKVGNSLVWQSNAYDVVLRWGGSGIKFDVVVKRNIQFDQVQFDVDKAGLSDAELLSYLTNLKAIDSSLPEPIVRPLSVSLVAGVLTLGFDLTGMTFPVTIDPTLNLQVGAGADDVLDILTSTDAARFSTSESRFIAGYYASDYEDYGSAARFLNVTIAPGSTINLANLILICQTAKSTTVVNTRLSAERNVSPNTFSNEANFEARTWTIAYVNWDAIPAWTLNTEYTSPDIKTAIQEVIGLANWVSGNPMAILWDDFEKRSTQSVDRRRVAYSYNGSAANAPKLHIEYTAGGGALSASARGVAAARAQVVVTFLLGPSANGAARMGPGLGWTATLGRSARAATTSLPSMSSTMLLSPSTRAVAQALAALGLTWSLSPRASASGRVSPGPLASMGLSPQAVATALSKPGLSQAIVLNTRAIARAYAVPSLLLLVGIAPSVKARASVTPALAWALGISPRASVAAFAAPRTGLMFVVSPGVTAVGQASGKLALIVALTAKARAAAISVPAPSAAFTITAAAQVVAGLLGAQGQAFAISMSARTSGLVVVSVTPMIDILGARIVVLQVLVAGLQAQIAAGIGKIEFKV